MPRKKDNEIYTYKKKNGETWYGFKTYLGIDKETGKSKKITRQGFRTRKEAEKAKTKLKADGATATAKKQAATKKTVQDVYNIWLPIYSADVKGSTYLLTTSHWDNYIQPEFGNDYIGKIDVDHLQRFANALAEEVIEYRPILNLLHRLIKYAIMRKMCANDPFTMIIIPKKSAKKSNRVKHNFYSLDELKVFLASAEKFNYKYYTYFMIIGSLGLRRGEALGLMWKDVDEKNKVITIARTVSKNKKGKKAITSTKTKNSYRKLIIPDNLLKVLNQYKEQYFEKTDGRFIFETRKGDFHTAVASNEWIKQIYKNDPSLRVITPHGFRHTLATILYEGSDKIKPKDVQALLGHKKVTTALNIYTHFTENNKKNIANSINNLDI